MSYYLKSKIDHIRSSDLFLFISMSLFVLLTRLPFINSDYGTDPDSFRVVSAAKYIANTGEYIYARAPGNPTYEYIISFVANSSPWVANLLSAIASSIAVIFFALILRHVKVKNYFILSILFAMVPVIYINSITTMDYMIALSLALGSVFFIFIRQPVLAGILIGLAVGCRLTYAAMVLPLALWILFDKHNIYYIKHIFYFVLTSIIVSILVFLPVFLSYGFGFFTFVDYRGSLSLYTLVRVGIINVWGILYLASFIVLFTLMLWQKKHLAIHSRKVLLFSIGIIFLFTIIFLRLPNESAFMIPVVPFVIMSLALVIPSKYMKFFSIIVIGLVFIQLISGASSVQRYNDSRELNYLNTKKVIDTVSKLEGKVVIVAALKRPRIVLFEASQSNDRVKYVYLINNKQEFNDYVNKGYSVYYLKEAYEYNEKVYNVNLKELGAKELDID